MSWVVWGLKIPAGTVIRYTTLAANEVEILQDDLYCPLPEGGFQFPIRKVKGEKRVVVEDAIFYDGERFPEKLEVSVTDVEVLQVMVKGKRVPKYARRAVDILLEHGFLKYEFPSDQTALSGD